MNRREAITTTIALAGTSVIPTKIQAEQPKTPEPPEWTKPLPEYHEPKRLKKFETGETGYRLRWVKKDIFYEKVTLLAIENDNAYVMMATGTRFKEPWVRNSETKPRNAIQFACLYYYPTLHDAILSHARFVQEQAQRMAKDIQETMAFL